MLRNVKHNFILIIKIKNILVLLLLSTILIIRIYVIKLLLFKTLLNIRNI